MCESMMSIVHATEVKVKEGWKQHKVKIQLNKEITKRKNKNKEIKKIC